MGLPRNTQTCSVSDSSLYVHRSQDCSCGLSRLFRGSAVFRSVPSCSGCTGAVVGKLTRSERSLPAPLAASEML